VEIAKARGEPNPIKEGYRVIGKTTGWFAGLLGFMWPWY
jgi:hypothetical protein